MAERDWDWHSKDQGDSIVVPQTNAIAVYTNPDGDVVVRQQGYPEDDSIIIIPKKQAKAVADAIKLHARDR